MFIRSEPSPGYANICTTSADRMTIPIADDSHVKPFNTDRYQRTGHGADMAPKVSSIRLKRLDLNNVRVKETDTHMLRSLTCTVHERCLGHILSGVGSNILLPRWCISDDPEMMDRRSKATLLVMSGVITQSTYAEELRSTLMGKRGLMRYRLLGSKPTTSMRGVATCVWNTPPYVVLVPKRWMKNMKVPYRKKGESDTLSPNFSFRRARDGDNAVLLRCPIVTDASVQPVIIMGWDYLSIGVHPEMCKPLNLDYDGDEVHVIVVSSSESTRELSVSRDISTLRRFHESSIASALDDSPLRREDNGGDFMVGTTVAMSQLGEVSYDHPSAVLSKCKESSRKAFVEMLGVKKPRLGLETIEQWSEAVSRMVISNLGVSLGHTFSRQLSIAAMTTQVLGRP